MKLSINRFAFNLGNANRLTREASMPFHKAYISATPEQQAHLRHEWQVGYIEGNLRVDAATAERILSRGKGAGVKAAHILAIDVAYSSFRHHVVRKTKAKAQAQAETVRHRISTQMRETAMDFLGNFEGKNLEEQIHAAIKLLNAMK